MARRKKIIRIVNGRSYGADDGSDDKFVTADRFSREFEITAMIQNKNRRKQRLPER